MGGGVHSSPQSSPSSLFPLVSRGRNKHISRSIMLSTRPEQVPLTVLVTGGCGYIGSHTVVGLLEQGYNVVVVDNLSNSSVTSLQRVKKIVGLPETDENRLVFREIDICDEEKLRNVFEEQNRKQNRTPFHACIHFAGLKVRPVRLREMC